jgi:hypothetical protein
LLRSLRRSKPARYQEHHPRRRQQDERVVFAVVDAELGQKCDREQAGEQCRPTDQRDGEVREAVELDQRVLGVEDDRATGDEVLAGEHDHRAEEHCRDDRQH